MEKYYRECVFIDESNNNLDSFSLEVEEGSRYLCNKYIKSDMKVLELGARYGTVSVCLDYILDNPVDQLLCVDPDSKIKDCLNKNKERNNCTFNIFNGAISKQELYVCYNGCGWETKTYIEPPRHLQSEKIECLSLEEIQKKYNIDFDCLLADCEGFLLEFIRENGEFFDNLKCVIYEEDCGENHPINNTFINYSEVERFLISKGFILQETYRDKIGLDNKIWLRAD
jgi:FkbM family methyltransferase